MSDTPRRSETMDIVVTVVATLNEVITALRSEVAALGENEKAGRKRISVYLAAIGLAVIASVSGVVMTYGQGQDVKEVVTYIRDCQNPQGECKKRNDSQIAGVVAAISASTFDSVTCVLNILPEERTDESVKACRDKYLGAKK